MAKLNLPQVQAILDELHDAGPACNSIRNVKAALLSATADVEKVYPSAYDASRRAKLPATRRGGSSARPKGKVAPRPSAIHALTPEQAELFLVIVESERLKALYWTTLLLGLRRGEALGLLLDDLDLEGQRLRISGAMQRQKGKGMVRLDNAKTEASETWLPLPDVLIPILRAQLAMLDQERTYKGWKENGLLFPSSVGTPIGDRNLIRHYKAMLERGTLPNIRFHDLRHSCATLLITLGVHPRIIMEILRHTQISTTMNLYGHAIPEVNRQAVNGLGELLQPATLELPQKVRKE
jgi:integrase